MGKGSRGSVSAWKEALLSDVTAGDGEKGKAAAAWIRKGVQGCWDASAVQAAAAQHEPGLVEMTATFP